MGKLIFNFGSMGSSKTANALMARFQFEQQGFRTLLLKPSTDTRDGTLIVKSRIGLQAEALVVGITDDVYALVMKHITAGDISKTIVVCDEAQFLTTLQVEQLRNLVDYQSYITVLCYGLRTDFQTHLFPGSQRLFELADKLIMLNSACKCGNKAIVNARIDYKGNVITHGGIVELGADDKYQAMCYKCRQEKMIKEG